MIDAGARLTFLQVGAFDGITRDPLRKYIARYGWRGVLIEPQACAADQLRALYRGNDAVAVIQAAVDQSAGTRSLFVVPSNDLPVWVGGLASFNRDAIVKHAALVPGLSEMIREEPVECVTFDTIVTRLPSHTLDVLQMDAEGADAYLLSLFPFDRIKPAIIHWEIKHLTKRQREDCFERLVRLGYRLAPSGGEDMTAVLF